MALMFKPLSAGGKRGIWQPSWKPQEDQVMFSIKRNAERERLKAQEAATSKVTAHLSDQLADVVKKINACETATLFLTFKGRPGGLLFGCADVDKLLYALKQLKAGGLPIKDHFAAEYAKLDKEEPVAPKMPERFSEEWWTMNYGPIRPVKPQVSRSTSKPQVSRSTSKHQGRLIKVTRIRSGLLDGQYWSDGTDRRFLHGFACDDPKFNGHPTTTGAIVDDYTVAGVRYVIDENHNRWEILS